MAKPAETKMFDNNTFDYKEFVNKNREKIITTMITHFPNQFKSYGSKTKEHRLKVLEEEIRSMSPEKFFKLYGLVCDTEGVNEATIVKYEMAKNNSSNSSK